jgi:hypothetical protein
MLLAATLPYSAPTIQAEELGEPGFWTETASFAPANWRTLEPDVAFDGDGFMHVVFPTGETDDRWAIFYTNNRNGAFSFPVRISEERGKHRNPDIAVSSDGHVHVAYAKEANADVLYVESPDLGATWGARTVLTPGGARAYDPAIAVDANNAVHIVWVDRRWSGSETATYVSKPANGGFGPVGKIGRDSSFELDPSITTTGSGANVRVHVVFQSRETIRNKEGNIPFDVLYAQSVGGSFRAPVNISNDPNEWSLAPSIASDGQNELYLAWDTQFPYHDIVFTRSTDLGATWAQPVKLTNRGSGAFNPSVSFGRSGGVPRVHIGWAEAENVALYVLFEAGPNPRFGDSIELVGKNREVKEVDVAASNISDEVAVTFQAGTSPSKAFVFTKGAGTLVTAGVTLNNGIPSTKERTINVKLSGLRGAPTEMRYSWNVPPAESAPWQPIQTDFNVPAPPDDFCNFSFFIQLRAVDGRRSATFSRIILIDSDVQASVDIRNPYFAGEEAAFLPREAQTNQVSEISAQSDYTRRDFFYLSIANASECTSLSRFFLGSSPSAYGISNNSFVNVLPLPGPETEGPRRVEIVIEDALGNRKTFARTMVLDRTPPSLKSGTLNVTVPRDGLGSILTDLIFENVVVEDALYPGGFWGAWITNVVDPTVQDGDPSLEWQSIELNEGGDAFVIENWSVLDGVVDSPLDRSFAGKTIEVRVKFLDGAGNATAETLKFSVSLAPNYRPAETYLPVIAR